MNRKKVISIVTGSIVVLFLLYHSVYFTSLTERMEQLNAQLFDPQKAIDLFWKEAPEKLLEKAIDLSVFDELLHSNPQELAEKYGKTLGIGAPHSILVQGTVRITEITDEWLKFQLGDKEDYYIRTGFIFSNTVREASGYFDLDKFETTMEFNLVAMEINQRIVKEVVDPIAPQLIPSTAIHFLGATDIYPNKPPIHSSVEIIPIQLTIVQP